MNAVILNMVNDLFYANATILGNYRAGIPGEPGPVIWRLSGRFATRYLEGNKVLGCQATWRDPTTDVIGILNDLSFRLARLTAKVPEDEWHDTSLYKGYSDTQMVNATQHLL